MKRPATFTLILIGAALSVLLAACNLGDSGAGRLQPTATGFGGVSVSSRATAVQIPSITPLFFGSSNATRVPFTGGSIGSSALQTQTAVALNPITASTPAFGAQQAAGTPAPVATRPGSVTVTIPTGQIAATANNIFGIIFEFLGGTISTFWTQAGQAGGFTGQVLCCLLPGIAGVIYLLNRIRRPFRRR